MSTEISLLPQSLIIDFVFQGNVGTPLIAGALIILSLAETAINNDDLDYWNIDDRLNKHRTVRDFDAHVQKMLFSLGLVGSMTASVVNSSGNQYHYVEFNDSRKEACIRILHTFNPKANYMKKYLERNRDMEAPGFAYIQYSLDKSKTKVRSVKAVIPDAAGGDYRSYDLSKQFFIVKQSVGKLPRNNINSVLLQLKKEFSGNILAGTQNTIEKGVENNV